MIGAYGIMERLIEHCRSDQLQPIVEELLEDLLRLTSHKFGNFVVQHIMEFGTEEHKHSIATKIMDAMGEMHRFPLYVYEMVLSHGLVADRIRLSELLGRYKHIIQNANLRKRDDMPHLMLLVDHAKQRLDEKATKPRPRFIGRVESQQPGTLHLHTLLFPSLDVSTRANADSSATSSLRDYVSGYCCIRDPGHRGVASGAQATTQEDLA